MLVSIRLHLFRLIELAAQKGGGFAAILRIPLTRVGLMPRVAPEVVSTGIRWIGCGMNRCVRDLQILQLYSQGVMPPKVLSNGAKLSVAKTCIRCVCRRSRLTSW
jgi:hypothetical protein